MAPLSHDRNMVQTCNYHGATSCFIGACHVDKPLYKLDRFGNWILLSKSISFKILAISRPIALFDLAIAFQCLNLSQCDTKSFLILVDSSSMLPKPPKFTPYVLSLL